MPRVVCASTSCIREFYHGGDSGRKGDPVSNTHVAAPFRGVAPDSVPNADKLGAGGHALSACGTRYYSLTRVARAWKVEHLRFLNGMQPNTMARGRPGLVRACSDAGLADYIRRKFDARRVRRLILPPLKWSDLNDVF